MTLVKSSAGPAARCTARSSCGWPPPSVRRRQRSTRPTSPRRCGPGVEGVVQRGPRRGRRQDDVRRAGTGVGRARRRAGRRRPVSPRHWRTPPPPPKQAGTQPNPMVARKGRASYLGQRSVGHQDPGATSAAMLIAAAATRVRHRRVSDVTVGLVVVSHSRALARAAVALAQEMLHGKQIRIAIAAGLDDTTFGTDAAQIVDAITAADQGAGVVVLMDLGSAVLSAELALELLDDAARERVVLCPAPLVEGLVVAAVAAAGGASTAEVAAEAAGALAGKIGHLGPAPAAAAAGAVRPIADELTGSFVVANPHGLHARPAARLVHEVRRRDARARVRNRSTDRRGLTAGSLSKLATLGVRSRRRGRDAGVGQPGRRDARPRPVALAARNFDESPAAAQPASEPAARQAPIGAAPGLGIGPARSARLGAIDVSRTRPPRRRRSEWRRLGKAIAAVRRTISQLRDPHRARGRRGRGVDLRRPPTAARRRRRCSTECVTASTADSPRVSAWSAASAGTRRRVRRAAGSVPAGPSRRRARGRRPGAAGDARCRRAVRRRPTGC